MSWQQVASRTVYESPWIRVREDDVIQPDGNPGMYSVVERRDFVVVIPFDGNGFHLVQQYRYTVGERHWEFPQGSWPQEPDDLADLARGELAEETGLRAGSMELLGSLYPAYGLMPQRFHVFLATELTPGDHAREATEADMEAAWVPLDEFIARVRSGEICDAPTLAAFTLFQLSRG